MLEVILAFRSANLLLGIVSISLPALRWWHGKEEEKGKVTMLSTQKQQAVSRAL